MPVILPKPKKKQPSDRPSDLISGWKSAKIQTFFAACPAYLQPPVMRATSLRRFT